MTHEEAVAFIKAAVDDKDAPQVWADLGCGTGTFTLALASLLPSHSVIHAIDKNEQTLPPLHHTVTIKFQQANFESDQLQFSGLHGILLANALHYVADPASLLKRLSSWLRPRTGKFVIVEYDRRQANRWVPYPLPFDKISQLMKTIGYPRIIKIGERESRYGQGTLYSCVATTGT